MPGPFNFTPPRRQFIKTSLALGAIGLLPPELKALTALPSPQNLNRLHIDTVQAAATLTGKQPMSLSILLPQGSKANVEPVANWFKDQANISIIYFEVPVDDINTRMMVDVVSGSGSFDLALPATFGLPDLIEAGALHNLDELSTKYAPQGFLDDSLYSIGDFYKGSLYGYQTDGDTYLMFYNQDMLNNRHEQKRFEDQHGFPLAVPKTWRELDAMMQFFQRPDEKIYGGALFRTANYMAWEWWIRFHAKGQWPLDENMQPQIDSHKGIEALDELITASKNQYPGAPTDGLFDNWQAFAQGNIFCNIGWGGTQKYLNGPKSKVRGKLAFGPTPGGIVAGQLVQTPYFNWGWNYSISKASKNPELAYLFALCACSPEMSTQAVREAGGYFDPFRNEHYEDTQIEKTYSKDFLIAHKESMKNSIPDLYLKGQGEYFDALRENILRAERGSISSSEAMKTTAKQWRRTTRRMGKQGQIEQWKFLRERYPEAIRKMLS